MFMAESVKCEVCHNKIGVWYDSGVKKLKGHMRAVGQGKAVCPGSDKPVR